jgi:hypothetical protein
MVVMSKVLDLFYVCQVFAQHPGVKVFVPNSIAFPKLVIS